MWTINLLPNITYKLSMGYPCQTLQVENGRLESSYFYVFPALAKVLAIDIGATCITESDYTTVKHRQKGAAQDICFIHNKAFQKV